MNLSGRKFQAADLFKIVIVKFQKADLLDSTTLTGICFKAPNFSFHNL